MISDGSKGLLGLLGPFIRMDKIGLIGFIPRRVHFKGGSCVNTKHYERMSDEEKRKKKTAYMSRYRKQKKDDIVSAYISTHK